MAGNSLRGQDKQNGSVAALQSEWSAGHFCVHNADRPGHIMVKKKKKTGFIENLEPCRPSKIKGLQKSKKNISTHGLTVLTIGGITYFVAGKANIYTI